MLVFGLFLLPCLKVVSAGSHSLMALATYISGQTPFPEFSAVVMLDDVQIFYYDSATWKPVYRSHSESKYYEEEQRDADTVFRVHYDNLKYLNFHYKDQLNHTGVHVTQRFVGCELLNNDKPGPLHSWDAFDGQNLGEITFDIEKEEIQNKLLWTSWDQAKEL